MILLTISHTFIKTISPSRNLTNQHHYENHQPTPRESQQQSNKNHQSTQGINSTSSSSDEADEVFDELVDEVVDNFIDTVIDGQTNKPKRRAYIERDRELGHIRLCNDYFSNNPTYTQDMFRRRFRMNEPLFLRIVETDTLQLIYLSLRQDSLAEVRRREAEIVLMSPLIC